MEKKKQGGEVEGRIKKVRREDREIKEEEDSAKKRNRVKGKRKGEEKS